MVIQVRGIAQVGVNLGAYGRVTVREAHENSGVATLGQGLHQALRLGCLPAAIHTLQQDKGAALHVKIIAYCKTFTVECSSSFLVGGVRKS